MRTIESDGLDQLKHDYLVGTSLFQSEYQLAITGSFSDCEITDESSQKAKLVRDDITFWELARTTTPPMPLAVVQDLYFKGFFDLWIAYYRRSPQAVNNCDQR